MGKIIPVILCGGSGARLWPVSRPDLPKQFLKLVDPEKSLLRKTFDRALYLTGADPSSVIIVTHIDHSALALEQLEEFCPCILAETKSCNTAAAVALAAEYVSRYYAPDSVMLILPCDGHIGDETVLSHAIKISYPLAQQGKIAVFGIEPSKPETGYGYIKRGASQADGIFEVERFVEKPDHDTAESYIASGSYLWNSGMSVFRADTILAAFENFAPDIIDCLADYDTMRKISFDVAILEKVANLFVIPCAMEWADIGTWPGLLEILGKKGISDEEMAQWATRAN